MAANLSPQRAPVVGFVDPLRTRVQHSGYSTLDPEFQRALFLSSGRHLAIEQLIDVEETKIPSGGQKLGATMTMMGPNLNYRSMEISCRAFNDRLNRTVVRSDFDYRNAEFTSQAVGNRQKRHQRVTPLMKWEFQKDWHKLQMKVKTVPPVVDDGPPRRPNVVQRRKHKDEHEHIRLHGIQKENREMHERLKNIHNRPRSTFCHLKRKGDYLVKGDAFSLPPPKNKGNYLVEMYKQFKLNNPVVARKSIRIQQEMLTSTVNLVQQSDKNKPSEEMVESEVQSTLSKEDEILPKPEPQPEPLSPVEVVKLVSPNIDAKEVEDIVMAMLPAMSEPTSPGQEESLDTNQSQNLEATPPLIENLCDAPQSPDGMETPSATTQSMTTSETQGETTQSVTTSETPGETIQSVTASETPGETTQHDTPSETSDVTT